MTLVIFSGSWDSVSWVDTIRLRGLRGQTRQSRQSLNPFLTPRAHFRPAILRRFFFDNKADFFFFGSGGSFSERQQFWEPVTICDRLPPSGFETTLGMLEVTNGDFKMSNSLSHRQARYSQFATAPLYAPQIVLHLLV